MSAGMRFMAVAAIVAVARSAAAQGGRVTIHGIAYDSLRGEPLGGASISTASGARLTTADLRGRFRFDSIAPGVYTFVMRHPAVDSVGLRGISTRATITDGRAEVRIAVPSFTTLWRAACGGAPPEDSGFVYGTIRDASSLEPIVNGRVELAWADLVVVKKRGVVQRRWNLQTYSDASGSYTLCGVPTALRLRIQARADSAASGLIDLPPRETRAQRRDLLVGAATASDSTRRGTITGLLTDATGNVFADARIVMDEVPEVRSGADGRFTVRGVPAGTRQLEVRAIGVMPVVAAVDVMAGETITLDLNVGKATTLQAMRVTAPVRARQFAAGFEQRRRTGFAYSMDSTQIAKYSRFTNVFHDIPSVRPEYRGTNFTVSVPDGRGGRCTPEVRIDGAEAAYGHLVDLFSEEVAALEVYPHPGTVPMQFLRPGIQPLCGIILVWTKYGFRNR